MLAPPDNANGTCQGAAAENKNREHKLDSLRCGKGQLIDRYGHPHSESIFNNWTRAAIKALGIRRVGAP